WRTSHHWAGKAFGGWNLAGSAILDRGTPINVTSSATWPRGDFNADGSGGDRPNAPINGVSVGGWDKQQFLQGIFRPSDFPTPAPGTDGALGRNAFRGPGFAQVDLSLSKRFSLTERVTAQIRADAFNALNRVNLANPVMDLANNNFGRSTSTLTPRLMQLGLRMEF
ncbi:MAG: hypothetical protein ABI806_28460, partial [Candidatus Solibacter sp.]